MKVAIHGNMIFYVACFSLRVFLLNCVFLAAHVSGISLAQVGSSIVPDSSLGTIVRSSGNVHHIGGGTIIGTNQFHSFRFFSVGKGNIASFNGPPSIVNILSRVTGGIQSAIDGTIKTSMPGANLFLMNPAGIIFGPNASLNVSGSVHFTTADYIRLGISGQENAGLFYADPAHSSLLSSVPVSAFGFLGEVPGSITYNTGMNSAGKLGVEKGNSLSLVGGDIEIIGNGLSNSATLAAPSGKVSIVSVASRGEILANNFSFTSNLNGHTFSDLGDIEISQGAFLDVSGNGRGSVFIRGGHLLIDNSLISADTIDAGQAVPQSKMDVDLNHITSGNNVSNGSVTGSNKVPGILLMGDDVELRNAARITSNVLVENSGERGSDIQVYANTIRIHELSEIFTETVGVANGGNIMLNAFKGIEIFDGGLVGAYADGTGKSGDIGILANRMNMNGGIIQNLSFGTGDSGNVDILIKGGNLSLERSSITTQSSGNAAGKISINIEDGNAKLLNRGFIFSSISGNSMGGAIEVSADNISLIDSFILVNNFSSKRAGGVFLNVRGNLEVLDGSTVDTTSRGPADSGDLKIIAGNDVLVSGSSRGLNSAISTQSFSDGGGGNLEIVARNVEITKGGAISASSIGLGNAGNIDISSNTSILLDGGEVTTEATMASGGNITLTAPNTIRLNDSKITSSVMGGANTTGGNINIDPNFVILQNSQIIARAAQGQGGNISITTDALLADATSVIDASSQFGVSGTVTVQSPTSNISQALSPLPESVLSAAALLRAHCAARKQGGDVSSFTEQGRDAVPSDPSGMMPSPLLFNLEEAGASSKGVHLARNEDSKGAVIFEKMTTEELEQYLMSDLGQICSS